MPKVNIPDVGTINFPDDMSPEDIQNAIETDILKTRQAEASVEQRGLIKPGPQAPGTPKFIMTDLPEPRETVSPGMRGLEAIEPSIPGTPEPEASLRTKILAAGDVAAKIPLGMVSEVVAGPVTAVQELMGGTPEEVQATREKIQSVMIPPTRSKTEQRYAAAVGAALDPLNALVPTIGAGAAGTARRTPRVSGKMDPLAEAKAKQDAKRVQQTQEPVSGEQPLPEITEPFVRELPTEVQAEAALPILTDVPLEAPKLPKAKKRKEVVPEETFEPYFDVGETVPAVPSKPRPALEAFKLTKEKPELSLEPYRRAEEGIPFETRLESEAPTLKDVESAVSKGSIIPRSPRDVFGGRQRGAVNPEVFVEGFQKAKEVVGRGITLVARNVGDKQLSITALDRNGNKVAGALFEPTNKFDALETVDLASTATGSKQKGLATEIYKYASELGNDVVPSKVRTEAGQRMWESFQRKGIADEHQKIPAKDARVEDIKRAEEAVYHIPRDIFGRGPVSPRDVLGKKQQGSWTPFSKKEVTPEQLQEQYRRRYGEELDLDIAQAQAAEMNAGAGRRKAVSKVPGMGKVGQEGAYKQYDPFNRADAVKDIKTSQDLPADPSWYTRELAPRGYLAKEIYDNPAIAAGYSVVKGIVDHFANRSEQTLFHKGGIYDSLTRGEKLFTPGDMQAVVAQMVAAKGNPNFKFNLKPNQQKLVEQIQRQFETQIKEVNEVRARQGKDPVPDIPNYFPGYFDGPFVFEVRNAAGGKPILMSGHNAHVAGLRAAWLRRKGLDVGKVKKREALSKTRFGTDNLVAEYELMMDMMADSQTAALRSSIDAAIQADATTASGYHNRFKTWKGYKGTLGDNPFFSPNKNYYDGKKAIGRSVEAHNQWMAANELAAFEKELTAGGKSNAPIAEGVIQKYIRDELHINDEVMVTKMQELVEAVTGVSTQKQKSVLRKYADFSTTQMIGNSFRALSQNFFQPVEAILPKLLQMTKNPLDIMSPMLMGLTDYMQVLMLHQAKEVVSLADSLKRFEHNIPEKLIGVKSSEMYKYASDRGIIDITMLESSPMFQRKLPNSVYKYVGGLGTRASEQAARFATFSTLTRYLVDAGWSKEKAMAQAGEWTTAHMVDYTSSGKPALISTGGVLGESLGRLQTYKMNNLGRYFSYIKYAKKNKDAAPLAAMLSINLALAGVQGLIAFDLISNAFDMAANADRDEKDFNTRTYVAENLPDWATYGILSDTTGLGFFNAFSQQVLGDDPIRSLFPVWMNAGEHARTIGRRLTTDPRGETAAEIGRELRSISPQILQPKIEKGFLTEEVGGRKLAISPFTGQPTYEFKGDEKGLFNVMPFERAKSSFLRHEMRKETDRFATARKDTLKDISGLVQDVAIYGNDNVFKQKKLADKINKYFATYGGTEDGLEAIFEEAGLSAAMPQDTIRILQAKGEKGQLSTSDIVELKRAIKYRALQEGTR